MAGLFRGVAELFGDAAKDAGEVAAKDVAKSSEVSKAVKQMPKASEGVKFGADEARPVAKGGKSVVKALPKAAKYGGILGVAAGAFGLAEGAVSSVGGSSGVGSSVRKVLLNHVSTAGCFSSGATLVVAEGSVRDNKTTKSDDDDLQRWREDLEGVFGAAISRKSGVDQIRIPILPFKTRIGCGGILYAFIESDDTDVWNEEDANKGPRHQRDGDGCNDDGGEVDFRHHAHGALHEVRREFFVSTSTLFDKGPKEPIADALPCC